jgi:hypothetical protein
VVRVRLLAALAWGLAGPAQAATVWSGPPIEFSKAAFADPTDPASQDLILPGVAITRGASQGLYNAALESSYSSLSPLDTEWAWPTNNPGKEISASNFADLVFEPWVVAHRRSPTGVIGLPGVLHIVSADVYLDIEMLAWGVTPGSGGSFAYRRATAGEPIPLLPEPLSGALALALLWALRRSSC